MRGGKQLGAFSKDGSGSVRQRATEAELGCGCRSGGEKEREKGGKEGLSVFRSSAFPNERGRGEETE